MGMVSLPSQHGCWSRRLRSLFKLTRLVMKPLARGFELQSPPLAFLAAVLVFVGFSDLVSLSMPDEVCLIFHWGTQGWHPMPNFYS